MEKKGELEEVVSRSSIAGVEEKSKQQLQKEELVVLERRMACKQPFPGWNQQEKCYLSCCQRIGLLPKEESVVLGRRLAVQATLSGLESERSVALRAVQNVFVELEWRRRREEHASQLQGAVLAKRKIEEAATGSASGEEEKLHGETEDHGSCNRLLGILKIED